MLGAIALTATKGLNFGIDFRGGILLEVQTEGPADIGALRATLGTLDLGDVSLQQFGSERDVLIRVQEQDGGDAAQQEALAAIKSALGTSVEFRRTETVGPQVGSELIEAGAIAIILSIGAIAAYVWLRFEWHFATCALIALMHDVILTIGVFSLLSLEFNLSTVAAVLTIAGYSINDTVVIFDRVRENMRKYKTMPMLELINRSVNETLSRTILTSFTTLLAVMALYVLGGEVISGFSFALMFGIIVGTYSTVYVAAPLLLTLNPRKAIASEAGDDGADDPAGGASGAASAG